MRSMFAALALAGSVAACSTAPPAAPEPVVRTVRYAVQVPVACLKELPPRPEIRTEAQILALGNYDGAFELWADWERRGAYIKVLETTIRVCMAGPESP